VYKRQPHARAAAGERPFTTDVLVQRAAVTDDPGAALADYVAAGLTEEMFDSPFLLVGTEQQIVERLHRLQEVGIDGVTTFAPSADALASALPHLR
jgi:alkanesulfonate monooxygenase SsuD/methylene tetrahydromethanopterin reductase-like flavin-dependent oxidoreductase (luciferase family)